MRHIKISPEYKRNIHDELPSFAMSDQTVADLVVPDRVINSRIWYKLR